MKQLSAEDQEQLTEYVTRMRARAEFNIGYPGATDYNYSELFPLFDFTLNNVGDPMIESTYELNSRPFELEVLNFFARIFHAPVNNWWGYITNGGSEGNLYALYVARELYPNGIIYYSEATHYSVQKNIHILGLQSITIRTQENGEMDYEDLREMMQMHRDQPVIILLNVGTTMTEARDNLSEVKLIFRQLAIKNHYVHCDAALTGVYAALLQQEPRFDFTAGCDSLAISGHKFIGSPIPSGLVLVKKNYKERIGKIIPYIGTADTTISGSRNGHSAVFLWYAIKQFRLEGLIERAERSISLAAYTLKRLQEMGIDAWSNPGAITIVAKNIPSEIRQKWQLATEGDSCHVICMPGITQVKIDSFLEDLSNCDAMAIETSPEMKGETI